MPIASLSTRKNFIPDSLPAPSSAEESTLTCPQSSCPEIQEIMAELSKILLENHKASMQIAGRAAHTAQEIRNELVLEMDRDAQRIAKIGTAKGFLGKLSQVVHPLALLGEGVLSAVAEGPTPTNMASIAMGGLSVIDTILDDAGKRTVATLLSRVSKENEHEWLERISTFSALATLGLSVCNNGGNSLNTLEHISGLMLDTAEAGASHYQDAQKATFILKETDWEIYGTRLQSLLGTVHKYFEKSNELFTSCSSQAKSRRLTTSKILGFN